MKATLLSTLIGIFIILGSLNLNAQNEYLDYSIDDTIPDQDFTIFNMNDFRDALVKLGINIYKWNMPIPKDKDYNPKFYIQEHEKGKLVKDSVADHWSTKTWGFNEYHRAEYKYLSNLRIISEMPDWEDKTDKLRLRMALYPSNSNTAKFGFSVSILPRPEYGFYYLRKFEETEFEVGKNIPLLLFTAGWEVNSGGELVRQYCGPNLTPADLNDRSLDDSDHYFVIGYRIVDEEFYGRD